MVTTSPSVHISVVLNKPPTITLTSPSTNAGFAAASLIDITAAAKDSDGTVTRVEFYNGATLIGSDSTSPYSLSWSTATPGTYTLSVRAIDNDGSTTISASVPVVISQSAAARRSSVTFQDADKSVMSDPNHSIPFKIYPNPNPGNKIHMEANSFSKHEMVTVTLQNTLGTIVESIKVVANENGVFNKDILITKHWVKGIYMITVSSSSKNAIRKIVLFN
jgi:hypothetical protein